MKLKDYTTTHTLGPWSAFDDEIVADRTDTHICTVALEDGINPTEWQANMRLIAAAPDLLAVAQSFVALYDGVRDVLVSDGVKVKLAAAEAAIAKATAIVAVLLIAATASAEPKSGLKAMMLGTFLTGGVMDIQSTCQALGNGGREVVLTQSCRVNAAIIGAEMAGGTYGLNKLYASHPKLAVTIGIAAGVFRASVAAHNFRVTR